MNHRSTPLLPLTAAAALVLLLTGCAATGNHDMPRVEVPPASAAVVGTGGAAAGTANSTADGAAQVALKSPTGADAGRAALRQLPGTGGVEVSIEVQGMAPGRHGLHIHAHGACAPGPDAATGQIIPFGAAGGHSTPS